MKKILVALMLCMVSIMGFGESYYWEKKVLPTVNDFHPDGDYIICYETADGKVKIFKDFTTQALTVSKVNDSTIMCDDSLQWVIERIENRLYTIQNNDGYYIATQYDKTEYGTLEYTKTYGLVNITTSCQIYSDCYNSGGCLNSWQYISFDKTTNTFNVVTHGDANISLYACKNGIENIVLNENTYKKYSDGMIFIVKNGVKYNILGQIVRN